MPSACAFVVHVIDQTNIQLVAVFGTLVTTALAADGNTRVPLEGRHVVLNVVAVEPLTKMVQLTWMLVSAEPVAMVVAPDDHKAMHPVQVWPESAEPALSVSVQPLLLEGHRASNWVCRFRP